MSCYLDPKTENRVKAYAADLGITPEFFVSFLVNEWLNEKGEFITRRVTSLAEKNKTSVSVKRRTTRANMKSSKSPEAKKNVASITSSPRFNRIAGITKASNHYPENTQRLLSAVP